MLAEEEVIDLQKDFVVYLLFTCEGTFEDAQKVNFYCEEFKEIIERSGKLSLKGRRYIENFCENIRLLLINNIVYDCNSVRLELVKAISAHTFTKAILLADERHSSEEHDTTSEMLDQIVNNCMKKSKNSETRIQLLKDHQRQES
ncbi:MAG: hypothetical protein ACRCY4_05820 [Brevinema sp.]